MAKKQTRKSISISGPSYDRLKTYCQENDKTMAGVVEALTISHLDKIHAPLFSPRELN
jgi:hypothetical protein